MPTLMLWGHGSFRTSNGYFKVPANIRIEFFIDDNQTIDDDAIRRFEHGDLSHGISDDLVAKAASVQETVRRIVKEAGDLVKNYKLESILDDPFAPGAKNALKNDNVWTPGKEHNDAEQVTYLADIVRDRAHLGSVRDPLVIQWCACTSNYIGDDEADAPVPRGRKRKIRSGNRSCCYITTATCTSLGLPDDCDALNKLRLFRDRVLAAFPQGAADVSEYYTTAPAIVRAIDRSRHPERVYLGIYRGHIAPALAAIDEGDHAAAYDIYARMVTGLKRQFLHRA